MQQVAKCNNSIPSNQRWLLQAKSDVLDCCNNQSHSHIHAVHHGTFFNVLIDKFIVCKHREIIIFAHNYFKNKTQTKQHFVLYYNQAYFSLY